MLLSDCQVPQEVQHLKIHLQDIDFQYCILYHVPGHSQEVDLSADNPL